MRSLCAEEILGMHKNMCNEFFILLAAKSQNIVLLYPYNTREMLSYKFSHQSVRAAQ